ncbi:uncharacterized protein CANTADRAFT_106924 [Suhomyces tanzawaensis NRRL Y-17324]|uniref:BOD1/SHG1 domain-containing protein n=1 Tax=Suhomyces tanzawaensis NRRL Y-17324 TaxID=984487 RepID=A0A1E4SPM9_9ASCO|nr:uncharacterized protein CANTADRAFT_106924 [Suhomyces tanzawaensis NRRL Y-17324]ODV81377.1 hypothetical protein CANTADRAFT_106924 [Suhomyces tanzawaensis NRRL Y-17324]
MKDAPEQVTDPKQLTTVYKKNGSFDKQRKVLLENFKQSETHANLLLKLKLMVESKVKQDPSILMKNKGKIAALIQGEIINEHLGKNSGGSGGLLSIVDKDIQDKIIDSPDFHQELKTELKDIRRVMMGISDEEYQKQLEEEKAEEEKEKREAQTLSAVSDYSSSSYRVKGLGGNHRISKPPRFNFSSNRQKEEDKDGKNGKVPFLMY